MSNLIFFKLPEIASIPANLDIYFLQIFFTQTRLHEAWSAKGQKESDIWSSFPSERITSSSGSFLILPLCWKITGLHCWAVSQDTSGCAQLSKRGAQQHFTTGRVVLWWLYTAKVAEYL